MLSQQAIGGRLMMNIPSVKITVGEFNERAFSMLGADKKEMLDYLKGKVVVRAGFKDFTALCKKKGNSPRYCQ